MVCLDKCGGSCNAADDLSTKIFVPNKTKDINVKIFNMMTRTYVNANANSIIQHVNQIKIEIIMHANASVKSNAR